MRLAVAFVLAFAAYGCADAASAPHPHTAADEAWCGDRMPARVHDEFDEVFAQTLDITPPAEHPPSRSLGYLGDQPIGVLPTPPHREPAWTRPFPCQWTQTCYDVRYEGPPFPPYDAPPAEAYSGD